MLQINIHCHICFGLRLLPKMLKIQTYLAGERLGREGWCGLLESGPLVQLIRRFIAGTERNGNEGESHSGEGEEQQPDEPQTAQRSVRCPHTDLPGTGPPMGRPAPSCHSTAGAPAAPQGHAARSRQKKAGREAGPACRAAGRPGRGAVPWAGWMWWVLEVGLQPSSQVAD